MESHGRRLGLIALAGVIAVALALPAAAPAVKPTAKLGFEFPDEGRVGFNHLVFKTKKKGKEVEGKRAKRLKRGSEKLSKKVWVKAKLKGGQIPQDVQVVGSVARIKGEKRTYAGDLAALHAGPGAQRVGSRALPPATASGEIMSAQGWNVTVIDDRDDRDLKGTYTVYQPKQVPANSTLDSDVTADDPDRAAACAPDGEFARYAKHLDLVLNGDQISKGKEARDSVELGGFLFCDQTPPGYYDYLFDLLDLDRPADGSFNCTGVRIGNNTPFGHTFTGGTCNQPIVDIRFEITKPAGGTYFSHNTTFPSCEFANGQRQVHCTSPASANKTQIQGSAFGTSQPTDCVRVTARSQSGRQYQAIQDTSAFATCP